MVNSRAFTALGAITCCVLLAVLGKFRDFQLVVSAPPFSLGRTLRNRSEGQHADLVAKAEHLQGDDQLQPFLSTPVNKRTPVAAASGVQPARVAEPVRIRLPQSYTGPPGDLAVCICSFSSNNFLKPIMNLLFTLQVLEQLGVPVVLVDLAYPGQQHRFASRPYGEAYQYGGNITVVNLHSNSFMFHKENLWNIALAHVPPHFTKLVFMDADVVIQHDNWPQLLSDMLETSDVVQPFERAQWLSGTDMAEVQLERPGFVAAVRNSLLPSNRLQFSHPGFAIVVRRDWLDSVGGFFPMAITGSGDSLFWRAVIGIEYTDQAVYAQTFIQERFPAWAARVADSKPRVEFAPWIALHLPHGSRIQRQYTLRHKMVNHVDASSLIFNSDGVLEFSDPAHSTTLHQYFTARNEDRE